MTEAEWVRGTDVGAMLEFLEGKASGRKYRLLACACCRLDWHALSDPRSRQAVEMAERVADGLATQAELAIAREAAHAVQTTLVGGPEEIWSACCAAVWVAASSSRVAAWAVSKNTERKEQPVLLREIFGNPFRPALAPASWPSTVVALAEKMYAGEGRESELRAALEEAGQHELADHFRGPSHPKGCWALDLILAKE
jgi:hypothetical protein